MPPSELAAGFERDGFCTGLRALEPVEAARARTSFDALEAIEGRERCQIGLVDRHFDQEFVWRLATLPPVLDAVEAAIGPDVMLLFSHFFCKYPTGAEEKFVAWHQDVTYWGLDPPFAVTAWYAVDDSDMENGCMRVIPGTHRAGIREHGTSERTGNLLSINQEASVAAAEEAQAVDLVLRAGEFSLHHGALIHGSNPNHSSRRRCGLTLRYVPPHVGPAAGNSLGRTWAGVLVRGRDPYQHYRDRPAPFPRR